MAVAEVAADVIVNDFLKPAVQRLSEQLQRNISLEICLSLDDEKVHRLQHSLVERKFSDLHGEVRILASDTAIAGRYKYHLQCIFSEQPELEGFSGIRLNGAIINDEGEYRNDYSGFLYTYNEWTWGKKVRDI